MAPLRATINGAVLCPDSPVHPVRRACPICQQQRSWLESAAPEILYPARSPAMDSRATAIISRQTDAILTPILGKGGEEETCYAAAWCAHPNPLPIIAHRCPVSNATTGTGHEA